jgi:MFS family permease
LLDSLRYALRALRHQDFRLYFLGQLVSFTGGWMQTSALYWLVYEMTGSEALLGSLSFASGMASCVVVPFAGVLLDKLSRRRVVFATQLLMCVQALMLVALVAFEQITIPLIIALSIFLGLVQGVDMPARQSLVGGMTPLEDLQSALALNASSFNVARFVGSSLGGLLIASLGKLFCFGANALSFLFILWALSKMKTGEAPVEKKTEGGFLLFKQGLSYVIKTPLPRALLPLIVIASAAGSYFALLPALASVHLKLGSSGYGILGGSAGIGSIIGAIIVARSQQRPSGARVIEGTVFFGLGLIALGLSTVLWASILCMVLVGFGMTTMYTAANSLLQSSLEHSIRGRVMSLYVLAFSASAPIGALLLTWVSSALSPSLAIISGGAIVVLCGVSFRFTLLGTSPNSQPSLSSISKERERRA